MKDQADENLTWGDCIHCDEYIRFDDFENIDKTGLRGVKKGVELW